MIDVEAIIKKRTALMSSSDGSFKNIFEIIHCDKENIFCEKSVGYKIETITYGKCYDDCIKLATYFNEELNIEKGSVIGLKMTTSYEWIVSFWALLMSGYIPWLVNLSLPNNLINKSIERLNVKKFIVDDKNICDNSTVINNELIESLEIKNYKFNWADEIIITTSATSLNIKYCFYKGIEFTNQIKASFDVIKKNNWLKRHYNDNLKLLVFLPFYHIFGLMAVYMWFASYGRCFVFLKDYGSDTIINTIRRHEVTHIIGVPLLFHTIYNKAIKEINKQDKKIINKFNKGVKLVYNLGSSFPDLSLNLSKKLFKEVREKLFGESVQVMISGGSYLSKDAAKFFNAVGYPIFNGYGMSEIGITSVETSKKMNERCLCSIGDAFSNVEYKIIDNELLVKSNGVCGHIMTLDNIYNKEEWFNTHDNVELKNNKLYIKGRNDDIVLTENGEKINPDVIEELINLPSVNRYLIVGIDNELSLVFSINKDSSVIKTNKIIEEVNSNLNKILASGVNVSKVYYTYDELAGSEEIKVSRAKFLREINNGNVKIYPFSNLGTIICSDDELTNKIKLELKKILSEIIDKEVEEIGDNDHFIIDLGGSSLDYFTFLMKIKDYYDLPDGIEVNSYYTIEEVAEYLVNLG